jgi:mediator of RNA polymerase II transcription subunit 8
MASEREAKQLEAASEALGGRVADVKSSLGQLILRLEKDPTLNWHSFLDSYALVSGQMNSLLKTMRGEKTPSLRKYITLPLLLSPDRDEELLKITDHRVTTFSHDLIPDYLRTRPDPELEARHLTHEARASSTTQDQQGKQLTVMDKVTRDTLKLITREREEMEAKSAGRAEQERTHSLEDTAALLAAINHGKGLKAAQPSAPSRQSPAAGPSMQQQNKAPAAIKTNIKAASQVHPYQR